jgi:hypothetical protein
VTAVGVGGDPLADAGPLPANETAGGHRIPDEATGAERIRNGAGAVISAVELAAQLVAATVDVRLEADPVGRRDDPLDGGRGGVRSKGLALDQAGLLDRLASRRGQREASARSVLAAGLGRSGKGRECDERQCGQSGEACQSPEGRKRMGRLNYARRVDTESPGSAYGVSCRAGALGAALPLDSVGSPQILGSPDPGH